MYCIIAADVVPATVIWMWVGLDYPFASRKTKLWFSWWTGGLCGTLWNAFFAAGFPWIITLVLHGIPMKPNWACLA
jgi:hypothetical protein